MQTKWEDSALFYASGEIDGTPHYVAASIMNGSVHVELDFGHNSKIIAVLGDYVTSNHWNNLTIFHNGTLVFVSLDDEIKVLEVPGENYNMIIDPKSTLAVGPSCTRGRASFRTITLLVCAILILAVPLCFKSNSVIRMWDWSFSFGGHCEVLSDNFNETDECSATRKFGDI